MLGRGSFYLYFIFGIDIYRRCKYILETKGLNVAGLNWIVISIIIPLIKWLEYEYLFKDKDLNEWLK